MGAIAYILFGLVIVTVVVRGVFFPLNGTIPWCNCEYGYAHVLFANIATRTSVTSPGVQFHTAIGWTRFVRMATAWTSSCMHPDIITHTPAMAPVRARWLCGLSASERCHFFQYVASDTTFVKNAVNVFGQKNLYVRVR